MTGAVNIKGDEKKEEKGREGEIRSKGKIRKTKQRGTVRDE